MRGSIIRRGKRSWRVKFDLSRDTATGVRQIRYHTVRGTRSDAEAKLHELLTAVGRGSYVEASKITVAEYLKDRLTQWGSGAITPRTLERYKELIDDQILPHLGTKPLQRLRPFDLEQWHSTLKERGRKNGKAGLSARTIAHAHRVLRKALNEAARNDLIFRNVAAIQGPPSIGGDEVSILNADQVASVVTKLRGRRGYPETIVALFTGARLGEVLALRWSAVDLDGKTMTIREALEKTKAGLRMKSPKTKAGYRTVTLPDIVVDVLRAQRRAALEQRVALGLGKLPDDALVFPAAEGGPQAPQSLSKAWRRAADDIGLQGVRFHALRHSHTSMLVDAGVDIVTISRRLGHASPNVTLAVYAHLFRQRDDKAANAINSALSGIAGT
jgi:integrase